ncbi:MAG: NAD(P)H-binding protein [Candidatus Dormibacteraeota bacterium]|nr:NAD(P)H-binding protein [Candidatus Dormibacteraeota bacterium]
MKIAVLGASGRTGAHVVKQGLERGHEIRGVARNVDLISTGEPNLTPIPADVLDAERVREALAGCEAVISTLGVGTGRAPTELYSRGIANTLDALHASGGAKLAVVSAAPVGPRGEQAALERWILMPVLDRLFGATYRDMRRMETILHDSAADWIVLRPPRLVQKDPTGAYRLGSRPLPKGRAITCPDLAEALLDVIENPQYRRQALYVAN